MIFSVWITNEIDKYRERCINHAIDMYDDIVIIGGKKLFHCDYIKWLDIWEEIKNEYYLNKDIMPVNAISDWIRLYLLTKYEKSLYFDTDVWFNKKIDYENGGYNKKNWISLTGNGGNSKQFKRVLNHVSVTSNKGVLYKSAKGCINGLSPFDNDEFYHGAQAYYKAGAEIVDLEKCTLCDKFKNIVPAYND